MKKRSRKRPNHGTAVTAGSLAWDALGFRLSREQIRTVRLQIVWSDVAPGAAGRHLWPQSIDGDELLVLADDSQWLHELTYLRDDLLRRIQERCPEAGVRKVRARVGKARRTAGGADHEPAPRPTGIQLAAEPSPETLDAIEHVRDPSLRHTIATARLALSRH